MLTGAMGEIENVSRVPPSRPILRGELAVCLQIEVTLHASHREEIPDLGTDSEDTRAEPAEDRMLTGIVRDLLIGISDKAHKYLLRKELGRAPVDVEIDPVLILRVWFLKL